MMYVKRRRGWRMSCDVGEVTESLENGLCYDYNYELCSLSNLSVASPTSQFILQPFFRFSYVTGSSLTSPCGPPMVHTNFSNSRIVRSRVRWHRGNAWNLAFGRYRIQSPKTIKLCFFGVFNRHGGEGLSGFPNL